MPSSMMQSATASSPMDTNSEIEVENNDSANLQVINNLEDKLDSSAANGPKYQSSSHIKSQVLPVVYIQAPSKLPIVTLSKSHNSNVIVKTVPPIQFPNLSSTISNKPIPSLTVPPNVLSNTNNSLKSQQQIVIQKSGGITNAFLTMIKPVANAGNTYGENNPNNHIHITTTTSPYVQSSIGQKYVIASIPKSGTTSQISNNQSKLSYVPMQNSPEPPSNNFKVMNSVLNFKIADGKIQASSNQSPITVMCDSNSISSSSSSESTENRLICTEVIDLDSPEKDEKSPDNDIIISTLPEPKNLTNSFKQSREVKFPQHGVSILKKNFSFSREASVQSPKMASNSDPISELIIQKDIMVTNPNTGIEEKVIVSEPKKILPASQKSGRRKSNFSFRKDFDEIPIEFFDSRDDIKKKFEDNDISLTKAENIDNDSNEKTNEDDIEIKLIKDKIEKSDINISDSKNVNKILKWENDIGNLPGSDIKFVMNEFNMIEYLTKAEYNKIIESKNSKSKEKPKDEYQEEIRCVDCGCFGLRSDFISSKYCSSSCQEAGKQKIIKEKENRFRKRKRAVRKREIEDRDESESSDDESSVESYRGKQTAYPWNCTKKGFSWSKYLDHMKAKAAPVKLFKDAFPYNRNGFKQGMKLEGVDPCHPSHFCVLTIAEVQGYRIRLHFDGFSNNYDFWVNADSMDIFPMGWCEKYGHVLHPPPGYKDEFNWLHYLKETKSTAAPKHLFANRAGNAICPNGFRVGMKLEAVDKKNNSSLICVATVRDMMDNRILVHFDSWDDIYDYWAEPSSPYIHPVGWCDQFGHQLTPPNDYPHPEDFTWEEYLRVTKSTAAPQRAFKQKPACGFKRGMKLESVDRRVPQLVRVASIDDVRGHQIKVHFDGWTDKYSYWVEDDCADIHPAGWCLKTGHALEPPLTPEDVYDFLECPTIGCKGVGHALGAEYPTHSSLKECPYADENLTNDKKLPDRLLSPDRFVEAVVPVSRGPKEKQKKVGRPRKYPVIEIKDEDYDDADVDYEKKPIVVVPLKKRKKAKSDDIDRNAEERIMDFLKDSQCNPVEREAWPKHSKFLTNYTDVNADPRKWSRIQVANFIESLPTGSDYADIFRRHDIDGEALLLLTQRDIIDLLNIKLGPAIKLYSSILLLRENIYRLFRKTK